MQAKLRRTKIVCTLGPATDSVDTLEQLLLAGANVVRLNFSHGSAEDHIRRAQTVRDIAARHHLQVAIMGDLQGPKIRVSTFKDGAVTLAIGSTFILDAQMPIGAGTIEAVGIDYKALPADVGPGDILLLDDGRVQLTVQKVEGSRIHTTVLVGGKLSNNKGLNKLGGGLSAEALTDKDKADLHTAASIGVDYLAISFPRCGDDLRYARKLAEEAGCYARIVAKVERAEAVATEEAMDEMIQASDVLMVARGDLGVEIGDSALVGVQKTLIRHANRHNKAVITATQMMESMINSPMPTRAEVMDVANAVLDGTDAVMLSAETASGAYPVETVKAMVNICLGAEKMPALNVSRHRVDKHFEDVEETIAMSAMYAANHLTGVSAIVAMTTSGTTALLTSRISSGLPIFAMSDNTQALNRTALFRGVTPIRFACTNTGYAAASDAVDLLKRQGYLKEGELVVITQGDQMGQVGSSNTCRIIRV